MYLFLDDIRNPQEACVVLHSENAVEILKTHDYVIVRNYQQFKFWIESNGLPALVSFDNDLGEPNAKTGYDCAKWLVGYCIINRKPLPEWSIHSANPVGVKNIELLFKSYYKHLRKEILSFKENADLGFSLREHQPPVTLEKAISQAKWVRENSVSKNKKKRPE